MFSIRIDQPKNLLHISIRGTFDSAQAKNMLEKLRIEVPKLKKGFKLLDDLSEVDVIDPDCRPFIESVMDLCNQHEVSIVVRIIADESKDIGFNIMSTFHYSGQVKIYKCKSLEEARNYFVLKGPSPFDRKMVSFLRIMRARAAEFSSTIFFRLGVLIVCFTGLIAIRLMAHAFGISLRYAYITLISIAGVWFGVRGGIIAALISMLIFFVEVFILQSFQLRDLVIQYTDMTLRFFIYLLSGMAIGYFADLEKKLRKDMEVLAGQDALTECYNYRSLMQLLEAEIMRSRRHSKEVTIALLDLDHFKKINDDYGHLVGNDALKMFSTALKDAVRQEDIVSRYGGEEFLIIFPESNVHQTTLVLERIKARLLKTEIKSEYLSSDDVVHITFSAGIASFPNHAAEVNSLINAADSALYMAKNSGRDKICPAIIKFPNLIEFPTE